MHATSTTRVAAATGKPANRSFIPIIAITGTRECYNCRVEQREGKLTGIGEILDRNIVLKGADVLTAKGFTQVPNHVLISSKLSPGAKLTYAMLLKYAWQNDYCFPGQVRLAKDMGVTDRSVRTYLQELERERFVAIRQRGLGKPNLYELNLSVSASDRKIFPLRAGRK